MRKRNHQVLIRLNDEEQQHLRRHLKKTGLSQEEYLRMLIMGKMPKETPPLDYFDLLRELHAVGNNLNQIAAKANAIGEIDSVAYKRESSALRSFIMKLQRAIELPDAI